MSKIGISIKIDVTKIDKSRLFAAQSGTKYIDLTMFLDPDNEGQYGDHGFITQSTTKEEREQQVQMPILGNGKIFYGLQELKGNAPKQQTYQQSPQQHQQQQRQVNQAQAGFKQQHAPQTGFAERHPEVNPQAPNMDFEDIPFAPIGLQYNNALIHVI